MVRRNNSFYWNSLISLLWNIIITLIHKFHGKTEQLILLEQIDIPLMKYIILVWKYGKHLVFLCSPASDNRCLSFFFFFICLSFFFLFFFMLSNYVFWPCITLPVHVFRWMDWFSWMLILIQWLYAWVSFLGHSLSESIPVQRSAQFLTGFALYKFSLSLLLFTTP